MEKCCIRKPKRRLKDPAKSGERVGKVIGQYKMARHFEWSINAHGGLVYRRRAAAIAAEAALDGLHVIRTRLSEAELDEPGAVQACKRLSTVERAFRSLRTVGLHVRPVFHRTADRIRAHVLVCMLAWYVEWHMRRKLRPIRFDDEQPGAVEARRPSVVALARWSDRAVHKAQTRRTAEGEPVHSFRTLI